MKYALVTGVSKGIGRKIAETLHQEGFYIYGVYKWTDNYRDEEQLALEVQKQLANLTLIPCDLGDRSSLDAIAQALGNVKLDAIVHNAAEFHANSWENFSLESWDRSIAINMEAPLLITKKIENNINDNASIVLIGSTDGSYAGFSDLGYAISKSGLHNVTRSLAASLCKRNIRVNAVIPGWVDTDMAAKNITSLAHDKTLLGRNAKPQEIADMVNFLLTPKASFITGALLTVDGGYSSVDYVVKKEFENE